MASRAGLSRLVRALALLSLPMVLALPALPNDALINQPGGPIINPPGGTNPSVEVCIVRPAE